MEQRPEIIKAYKLSNGQEIIGVVKEEVKDSKFPQVRMSDVFRIVINQGLDGTVWPSMMPWTVQSMQEDLPPVQLQISNIVASYQPSQTVVDHYNEHRKSRVVIAEKLKNGETSAADDLDSDEMVNILSMADFRGKIN